MAGHPHSPAGGPFDRSVRHRPTIPIVVSARRHPADEQNRSAHPSRPCRARRVVPGTLAVDPVRDSGRHRDRRRGHHHRGLLDLR
ncbi:MAG: hypothetical protein ACK559_38925, partial [bacterium]